jgi:probable rRNA maturation factor
MDILNRTKTKKPSHPYEKIKNHYLGAEYELSLVFCGEKLSRRLNRESRGKDYSANILSFPLSDTSGEIFIDLATAKKQCKKYKRSFNNYVAFLFIHGLAHLAGYDHGDTMDRQEEQLRSTFGI